MADFLAFWLSAQLTIHCLWLINANSKTPMLSRKSAAKKNLLRQLLKGKLCAQLAYRHIGHAYRHTDEQTNLYRTFGA